MVVLSRTGRKDYQKKKNPLENQSESSLRNLIIETLLSLGKLHLNQKPVLDAL